MNLFFQRQFAITFSITLFAFTSAQAQTQEPQSDKKPLNIILIMADDLGYETITANGGESYQTPNIDKLAANGARFEHCYAQPICTPSRVKIMTGKSNIRNYQAFGLLPRKETTFAHPLKKSGYATCIAGKWQLGSEKDAPQHFGFDEALLWQHTTDGRLKKDGTRYDKRYENPITEHNGVPKTYNNGEFAPDLMVDFICNFIDTKKDKPFFVYYPMILTHCPFIPTPDSKNWNPKSFGSPTYLGDPKYFGDMVTYMDKLVGRIVKHIDEQGLSDNTIVLFTGDNGTDKPVTSIFKGQKWIGGKGKTTDAGTRVPFIAYSPKLIKPAVYQDLVEFSDFLPSICEMANSPIPANTDGQSFLPKLLGEKYQPKPYIYSWYNKKSGDSKKAKVFTRNQRYKLYRSGKFYDIQTDTKEKSPLKNQSLNPEQFKIKAMLQKGIDHYEKSDNT